MTNRFTTLAAAAALFLGLSAPAAAGDWTSLGNVAGWDVLSNERGCLGAKAFPNGTSLIFVIRTDGRGRISIMNKQWSIPAAKHPVTLSVDRLPPVTFTGEAEDNTVSVWWKASSDEINIISNGVGLHAEIGKENYYYNLAGSAAMLTAVTRCTVDRIASANPFAGTAPQANAPPSPNPFPETASNPYRRM